MVEVALYFGDVAAHHKVHRAHNRIQGCGHRRRLEETTDFRAAVVPPEVEGAAAPGEGAKEPAEEDKGLAEEEGRRRKTEVTNRQGRLAGDETRSR